MLSGLTELDMLCLKFHRSKHFTFEEHSIRRSVTLWKKTFCFQNIILSKGILRSNDSTAAIRQKKILCVHNSAFNIHSAVSCSSFETFVVHKSAFNIHSAVSCSYAPRSKDILQSAIHRKAFSHSVFIRQPLFNILAFRGNAIRFDKDGTFFKEHTFCAVLPFSKQFRVTVVQPFCVLE